MLDLLILFALGSIAGWILEVIRRSIVKGKFVNPGFLTGPYLPVYGFGIVALYFASALKISIWFKVFLFFIATTGIELIGGLIYVYHLRIKLWDYSKNKFNYKGIICLRNSIYWVLLSLVFYYALFPLIADILSMFKQSFGLMFTLGLFYGFFFLDEIKSMMLAYRIRGFMKHLNRKKHTKRRISFNSFVKYFPAARKFVPKDFVKNLQMYVKKR